MLLGISQNLLFRLLIVINIGAYNLEASEGRAILAIDSLALLRFPRCVSRLYCAQIHQWNPNE